MYEPKWLTSGPGLALSNVLSQVRHLWSMRYKHNRDYYAQCRAIAEGLAAGIEKGRNSNGTQT